MQEPNIYYPLDLEPRKQQIEMLEFAAKSINYSKKYILLDSPTGVGKSYFTVMLINWYLNNVDEDAKIDMLTNSKVLQEQYMKDYPFITNLKGRANYFCETFGTDCEKGMELCSAMKKGCDACPYKIQRVKWEKSQISLTNFHMFNTFCMYNQAPLKNRDVPARLLIVDESHDFESVYSDFISIKLGAKLLNKYGFSIEEIQELDKRISRINKLNEFEAFIRLYFMERIESLRNLFDQQIANTKDVKRATELTKYTNYITGNIERFKNFIEDYNSTPNQGEPDPKENWVMDISVNDKNTMGSGVELSVQPVWVHKYLPKYVWNLYDHIIFMSGTILDKNLFSFINGLDPKLTTYKCMESPFEIKNRPIYYVKCGKMTYNEKTETFNKQKEVIKKILDKNKSNKGIIHATTYEFSTWIQNSIYNERLLFHTAKDREERLEEHLTSQKPSVIVSPSMHTGVDLKDDLSRFQILIKIPYPNISSNKVKQRQKTKPEWYQLNLHVGLKYELAGFLERTEYSNLFEVFSLVF